MVKFFRHVDLRSRKAMVAFLTGHFRYDTMRSWNRSTSYACNLKVTHLGVGSEIVAKLLDLLSISEFYEPLADLCREFGEEYGFAWQAGFNGRSGGYLVLYQGETSPSGYKSICTNCGQQNFRSVAETGTACGVCHQPTLMDYSRTHMKVSTFPGRGTDDDEDFAEWDMYWLRERVKLVQAFDRLADALVAEAIYIARNYRLEEESYTVVQTRQVLIPAC